MVRMNKHGNEMLLRNNEDEILRAIIMLGNEKVRKSNQKTFSFVFSSYICKTNKLHLIVFKI